MTRKQFEIYYSIQITALKNRLVETIRTILNAKSASIVKITLVDKGTCVAYENDRAVVNGRVEYVENIDLRIGFDEVEAMYNSCELSLLDAFNKVVTHEFLHVLFGDFNKLKLTRCYNYYIGSSPEESLDEDDIYFNRTNAEYDKDGYKKIDRTVYNYAADFVINRELNIDKPFLRAEQFGFDPDLNVFQYYSILMNDEDAQNKLNSLTEGKDLEEVIFTSEDLEGKTNGMSKVPVSDKKMMEVSSEELLEDLFTGKEKGYGPGNLEFVFKLLHRKNSIFLDYTKKIISEIKNDLFNTPNIAISKEDSWFKYNNRKDYGNNFVTPGKITVTDPNSKNTEKRTAPVIFVDCSGSMIDVLKELFYFCYNLLSYITCTVVFYDTKVIKVISSATTMNFDASMFGAGGGTSIKDAVEDYKKHYKNKMNNIYVFTDGYDDFDGIDVSYMTVYIFNKEGIVQKLKKDLNAA